MAGNNKPKAKTYRGGVVPFDPRGKDTFGGGRKWPAGRYSFEMIGYQPNEKKTSIGFRCKCGKGPGDTTDFKDKVFIGWYGTGDSSAGFLMQFLTQICPEVVEEQNLVDAGNGKGINMAWVDGGPNGVGAMFEATLYEDSYADAKSGATKTNMKIDGDSVTLLAPSSHAASQGAAAAAQPTQAAAAQPADPWAD